MYQKKKKQQTLNLIKFYVYFGVLLPFEVKWLNYLFVEHFLPNRKNMGIIRKFRHSFFILNPSSTWLKFCYFFSRLDLFNK